MIVRFLLAGVLVGVVGAGCRSAAMPEASGTSSGSVGTATELTVFAAASLAGVIDDVETAYAARQPGTALTVATGSSAALATQIEQGAPADVFLSADTDNAQRLVDAGLVAGGAVAFAGNELTIIVPLGNPAEIGSPADLARPGVKVIGAGEQVPITRYADRLVAGLAAQPGYPDGFEADYRANLVSREDDVKAIVAKIELGEGDAGIVYTTDAAASSRVEVVEVPASANVRATYAGVVIAGSARRDAASAFLAWLSGPGGRAVLGPVGFLAPVP